MASTTFFNAFVSYLVVIDPIACALIFYSLTIGQSTRLKAKTIVTAMFNAFCIILAFALFGEKLLTALGIDMDSLRIAGGILLFHSAFGMITSEPKHELPHDAVPGHITVYPMAIPLAAGPGTLTLTVLLMADSETGTEQGLVLLAALLTLALVIGMSLLAGRLRKLLGKTGDEIIQRLLGVLLAALAIQFVANGINGLFF